VTGEANCVLCTEPVDPDDDTRPIGTEDGMRQAHRECLLRSVLGGIGHLTDHFYWCIQMHDPDGGCTYRQSALECDAWVRRHGITAAIESKPPTEGEQ
jgi:hypothetical protein